MHACTPASRYEGGWASAVYEGAGRESFAKGSTYSGGYAAGLREGWGCCRFFNGDLYEGRWHKGLRHGHGMQQVSRGGRVAASRQWQGACSCKHTHAHGATDATQARC